MDKLLVVFLVLSLFVVPGAADHNEDLLPDGIQNSIDYRGQTGNPDMIKNSRDIPAIKMGTYRAASGDRCIITVQEVDNVQQDLGVLTVEKGTGMVGPKDFPSYSVKKAGKAGFGDYDGGAPKLYGPLSDNPENIEIQGDVQVDFPVVCQENSGGHAVWKQDENIETENGGGLDSGNNWYCYLDNTDGDRLVPKTCTGSSDEISTQGADVEVSSWGETYTRGLCGYGGMTKDFDQNPGMVELYVKAETLAWGQAGVYVEDSDGDIHTIKEWSGGGSTTSSDWTLVEEDLVGYGNNIKLIVGNDDNSENCGNNDHEFRIWASEDNPVEDSSTSTNEEERDSSNEETTENENEDNNNNNEEEQQEETQQTSGDEESQPVCNGEFDAWLAESTVADYPIEIRGCTTDDLEQINVMMGYDDGVTSYSTLSMKTSGVNCNGGECELTNVEYNEHDDRDYGFTMEITDGKNFADLNKPVEVDTDLIALKETYTGGRAGNTDSQWLEEACSGSTYSCVDSEKPYKADLVATVGLKTDYSPGSSITLTEGQTVRFPEGCDYQATYVYQNQPKIKVWHSGTSTGETSIGDTENFETSEGTSIEINTWNTDEVSLSATCSEWDAENEENNEDGGSDQEVDTDITWINYCQNQDSGDLTQTENIVSCLSSCYGESKDSSAEGSEDLTCGEVVNSYCDSANAEYDEEGDTARCS